MTWKQIIGTNEDSNQRILKTYFDDQFHSSLACLLECILAAPTYVKVLLLQGLCFFRSNNRKSSKTPIAQRGTNGREMKAFATVVILTHFSSLLNMLVFVHTICYRTYYMLLFGNDSKRGQTYAHTAGSHFAHEKFLNHDLPLTFRLLDLADFLRRSGLPIDISRPESVAIASSESGPTWTFITFLRFAICKKNEGPLMQQISYVDFLPPIRSFLYVSVVSTFRNLLGESDFPSNPK